MARSHTFRLGTAALLLAAYWLALFVATHLPMRDGMPANGVDKLFHVAAYAGLALMLATVGGLWNGPSWRSYLGILVLIAAYGALDEWMQLHVPGRNAHVLDWVADLVGGTAGLLVHAGLVSVWRRLSGARR